MKVLITGANGQLGKEFVNRLSDDYVIKSFTKNEMDITNQQSVFQKVIDFKPNLILHCAAYTKVDQCEEEREQAFLVNGLGTFYIVNAARLSGADLVYFSTDYVFDGLKQKPYEVDDLKNPQSIYGKSKFLGEQIVQHFHPTSYIIRTSWLYGNGGHNFVKTMLQLGKQGKEINVVADQIGSPTYTKDLVEATLHIIEKPYGIYHVSNLGSCSWFEFAQAIFLEAGYNPKNIHPVTTEDYAAKAPRPAYSVFSHRRLEDEGIQIPRYWKEALMEFIKEVRKYD